MYDNNGPGIFSSFIGVLLQNNIAANPTFGKIHIQCVVGEEMASPITPKEMEESSDSKNNIASHNNNKEERRNKIYKRDTREDW